MGDPLGEGDFELVDAGGSISPDTYKALPLEKH